MTYLDITNDLPHCFNEQGICMYCDNDRDELGLVFGEDVVEHCEDRAHFEAQR